MTIEQKAREIARQTFDITDYSFPHGEEAARLSIIEGVKMAIKALQDDAEQCDCSAWAESECVCGAWWEWKTIPSHRAVEIVLATIEGQKV